MATACVLVATTCATGVATSASAAPKVPTVSMFGGQLTVASNLATNQFTKFAKKRWGLTFSFDTTPDADVATKEPLLLASGQYPDVIWDGSITQEDALKYGSEGVFKPLGGLLKKYAPNVWHVIQTVPGFKQDITAPDGKIYALPSYNYCFHCDWTYEYYINIKDLDKYHLNLPRTTSQFAHVLQVFKQHGLTPITGSGYNGGGYAEDVVTYLMNSFIPFNGGLGSTSANYLNVKGKKVIFAPSQPQWRQGLTYLHKLYAAGDFSKVAFTQESSAVTSLISEQKVGVVPNGAIETAVADYGSASSHYLDWMGMPPLKGPQGVADSAFNAGGGIGGLVFAVTNKATMAQEVAIMKMLNYIWTAKGFLKYNLGSYVAPPKPGQTGLVPGKATWNLKDEATAFVTPNFRENTSWFQWGPYYDGPPTRNLQASPPAFGPTGSQTLNQLQTQIDMAGRQPALQYPAGVFVPASESQTYASDLTNIDTYVEQWVTGFITGQRSLSGQWNKYLAGLKSLGLPTYLKMAQKAMASPVKAGGKIYSSSASDIKFLLCKGSVPALQKKYLLQSGVPSSDFSCGK